MTDLADEFSFLPAQAADAGIATPLPRGERLTLTLPDGRALSALRYGDDPPTVTFVHGAGLNAHTWDTTILALGQPALAVDLAGHGDSSWREDAAYTAPTLAPDVIAALEAWTDRPQLLVGQSLGGLVATRVAAERPDLVDRLVVVDITPGVNPSEGPSQLLAFFAGPTDWASRDELVDHAVAFGLGGARSAAERGVFHNSRIRPDGRVEWKHHFAHLANAAAATGGGAPSQAEAVAAALGSSGWDDLAGVQAPLTLVRGTRGYVTEADAALLRERVPAASVVELPTGHNVHEDAPVALAKLLETIAAHR